MAKTAGVACSYQTVKFSDNNFKNKPPNYVQLYKVKNVCI